MDLKCILNASFIITFPTEILFLAEWWSGSDVKVYTNEQDRKLWGKEHAVIVMNHTYEVDWLMGWIVGDRSSLLGVSVGWLNWFLWHIYVFNFQFSFFFFSSLCSSI